MFGRLKNLNPVTPDQALPGRTEKMPVPSTHAVLGTSMQGPWPEGHEVLYVGMGCFWGAERFFWQMDGVFSTAVGYMGGWTPNATYEEACSGMTGHTEAVRVVFDPSKVSVDDLMKVFWEMHDPTTPNQQGNDVGTQYRSAIYPTTTEQMEQVRMSAVRYQSALESIGAGEISTEIVQSDQAGDGNFYMAEAYHQQYLHKNPSGYCNHGFCQIEYAPELA